MIDILIPTYEPDPAHLKQAIESVLAQTEQNWQIFIHDDCSSGDVREMIEPFLKDPRITFERSAVRLGIGGNWNASLQKGASDYVQYLFQDDHWEPTYLASMQEILDRHPSVGFVSAEHLYACEEGISTADLYQQVRSFKKEHMSNGIQEKEAFLRFWIEHQLTPNVIGEPSFVMLRRSLMRDIGPFTEDMPQFLDVEYWLRCVMQSDWFYLKEDLGTFRVHSMGASAQNQTSGAGIYDRLECFERVIHMLPTGALRSLTIQARNKALVDMARKFLKRRKDGKHTPIAGSGKFKKFAVRHPLLIVNTFLRAFTIQEK